MNECVQSGNNVDELTFTEADMWEGGSRAEMLQGESSFSLLPGRLRQKPPPLSCDPTHPLLHLQCAFLRVTLKNNFVYICVPVSVFTSACGRKCTWYVHVWRSQVAIR